MGKIVPTMSSKWITVKLPTQMVKDIDKFTKTPEAMKYGISSRTDLLARLITGWLSNYDDSYNLFDKHAILKAFHNAKVVQQGPSTHRSHS
jgi:hypothetical protein